MMRLLFSIARNRTSENYKLNFKGFVVKGFFQRPLSFGFISKASFTFPPLPPSIFSSVFTFGKWADCHHICWHHNHPPITQSNHLIPIHLNMFRPSSGSCSLVCWRLHRQSQPTSPHWRRLLKITKNMKIHKYK